MEAHAMFEDLGESITEVVAETKKGILFFVLDFIGASLTAGAAAIMLMPWIMDRLHKLWALLP